MRYDTRSLDKSVALYKKLLSDSTSQSFFIYGLYSVDAFLSIAPLSRALHELGRDAHVVFYDRKKEMPLFDVWDAYEGRLPELMDFIKTTGIEGYGRYFERPSLIRADSDSFVGDNILPFQKDWFRPYRKEDLGRTGKAIVKNVLAPGRSEVMGIGFELLPARDSLTLPLQDYLDSYAISMAVIASAGSVRLLKISSSTPRKSLLDLPEKVSEISQALLGCELSKLSKKPVFRKYAILSEKLRLSRLEPADVVFGIRGKGYSGRHLFGEKIGYPSPDGKTRWDSLAFLYKFSWYPQSHKDPRPPMSRTGFTSTVPIDVLIDSVDIDYKEMRARNRSIAKRLERCDTVVVKGKDGCDFVVGLVKSDGTRRRIIGSDSDVRTKLDPYFVKQGRQFGRMANIPGGEAFTTPEYLEGIIVGDVVISLDQSYRLSYKEPLVIKARKGDWRIVSGPKLIRDKLDKKVRDSWKRILRQEKEGSVPKEIIELKKKNFRGIGEFAINTNPRARLCDYLIVNEKIAGMIHIALGSGFEQDKATEYHIDIVIDALRQRLDIYGLDAKSKEHWIMRDGKPV